ncbi:2-amino-4-hydroxy-6-hydroxymethyldihydropteridine diphosphokinase [Campylobacter fetus]|uniref:2-amino-4-hydroxy-6- hydroxymethyldihydropteridine diphosphokinase n=1 Tax=Campylobacter fetus TaxID=196 RepID=UPI0008189182|nr:2-amino-4-hydroxy-6-hydroxymethyldihydropteridine diphosphokinase [Campylobacter fetus]OCR93864.1 2-amino-4-hydroxy-6-hydroxymethyldihydropteridine pyrophosphokinase [Campylobacter fetus subsp. testudinum]
MQTIYLDDAKCIMRSKFFPLFNKFDKEVKFKYTAFIGLGGNIGNTKKRFETFLLNLKKDRRFFIKECSPILKNRAFGYISQDYLNAVIMIKSSLYATQILKVMQHYEFKFKRQRPFKNAPRTLDLDILYFSKKVRKSAKLTVPHIGAKERISVIIPIGLMKGI